MSKDTKKQVDELHEKIEGLEIEVSLLRDAYFQLEKAKKALEESERNLNKSQEIAHLGSWHLDIEKNVLTWTDEIYRIFGLKPQEFAATYEAFLERVHPDDRKKVDKAYWTSVKKRQPYNIEHRIIRPDGSIRIVNERCDTEYDKNGKALRSIGNVQDITERKKIEGELNRYKFVIDQSTQQIAFADLEGNITYVNNAWAKDHGYKKEELIGKHLSIFHPETELTTVETFNKTLLKKGHLSGEIVHKRKDGSTFPALMHNFVLKQNNKPIGLIGVAVDITKEKQIDMMKTEFVSLASHQLRTPIGGIKLLLETFKSEGIDHLTTHQQEFLTDIEVSTERMIGLIDQLLDISRLEGGKIDLQLRRVDLPSLVEKTIGALSHLFEEKRIKINYKKPSETLSQIRVDKNLTEQVIQNLLTNAAHYSRKQRARVDISLEEVDGVVILSIKDNGIGISKHEQQEIFTRFFRADNARKVYASGSGLGLYISKMIVRLLNGQLWFKSPGEGKGSTFFLSFPTVASKKSNA